MSGPRALQRPLAALSAVAVAAAGLAVAGSVAAGAATSADAAANLVANPGFESGLSGWSCTGGSGTAVGSPVRSGSSALRAVPSGQDNARCSQTVGVQPNSAYTLTAHVQGSYVHLGATGTGLTGTTSAWTPNSASYAPLTVSFTTGPSTTSVTVHLHGWYGQPAYHADDVSLTGPGGTPRPPAPRPPAPRPPAPRPPAPRRRARLPPPSRPARPAP
nr:carbohydrate binding domain-containing protein [Streptomyces sp. 2P-4]